MRVETVQGPVEASDLGTTLVHEHVRFRDEAVAENWPGRYDDEAEMAAAVEAVTAAKDRGVRTIVDPTAMFGGRSVRFMREVAERTGVRIVACTGIYTYVTCRTRSRTATPTRSPSTSSRTSSAAARAPTSRRRSSSARPTRPG
jgi:phosphotriesterase-related protein